MKNLKKLSREELKTIGGGLREEWGSWACCKTDGSGRCSKSVSGDSDDLVRVDKGTVLTQV